MLALVLRVRAEQRTVTAPRRTALSLVPHQRPGRDSGVLCQRPRPHTLGEPRSAGSGGPDRAGTARRVGGAQACG